MPKRFNTQAQAPALPSEDKTTHITNYHPSQASNIIAGTVAAIVLIILAYFALGFLLEQALAGELAAQAIVYGGGFLLIVAMLSLIIGPQLDRYYKHKQALAEMQYQAIKAQALGSQGLALSSRRNDQNDFLELLDAVMSQAYTYQVEHNTETLPWNYKPWSRRKAGQTWLASKRAEAGEALGAKVAPWLIEQGVISSDAKQINLDRFPTLESFRLFIQKPLLIGDGNNA